MIIVDFIICSFKGHNMELVLCSKEYDKSLHVCRRCGLSWWFTPEPKELEIQDGLYLKKEEML